MRASSSIQRQTFDRASPKAMPIILGLRCEPAAMERGARIWAGVVALALHVGIVALLLHVVPPWHTLELPKPIVVSLIETSKPKPHEPFVEPPKPVVKRTAPQPQRTIPMTEPTPVPASPAEAPVIASAAPAAASAREAPVAVPTPSPVVPASVPTAPIVEPKFDAAYLNNPAPAYPAVSRRLGEQGRVILRVHVDEMGMPTSVVLGASSGFERLDNVALETVRRWKFVPARRGNDPVSAYVIVPIAFNLRS